MHGVLIKGVSSFQGHLKKEVLLNDLCSVLFYVSRLGGPDPLDYISMYRNPGQPANAIPPHWHYVTCGFSDLHGDGRVHE